MKVGHKKVKGKRQKKQKEQRKSKKRTGTEDINYTSKFSLLTFTFLLFTFTFVLMFEVPDSGKDHGDFVLIRGFNDRLVSNRAAGLDYSFDF